MTTEIIETTEEIEALAPLPVVMGETKNGAPPKLVTKKTERDKEDGDDELERRAKESKPLREMRTTEDMNIKQIVEALGQSGPFKITVKRLEPEEFRDPVTGRNVNTAGTLKSYDQEVDEDFIQAKHGGGKYELIFKKRGDKGGFQFVTSRRIEIAGDPRLDDVPRNLGPTLATIAAAPAAVASEAPSVVTKAMEMMERQANHLRESAAPAPVDTAAITKPFEAIIDNMQAQMSAERTAHNEQMSQMRAELAAARAYKAPEDPIKEKILNSLIDGESGRISGLRATHESELRTIKANAIEDEKRLRDAFERDKASLTAAFDRERQTMIHSHEIALNAAKASFDMQVKMLEGQIKTLERDCGELRVEVKDLRAKKEKSVVDMARELKDVKEVLGDEDSGSSTMDKIADIATNPDALRFAQNIIRGPQAGQQQAPAQQQAVAQGPQQPPPGGFKRQVVKTATGEEFILEKNGGLTPVMKKGKGPAAALELPVIPEEKIRIAVTFLERAVENGSEPENVALGARSLVPDEIISVLRDHGPDIFMTKVAKIPTNSPLSTQEGKNWIRKFAKALVGG